jgi:hypothetical protein
MATIARAGAGGLEITSDDREIVPLRGSHRIFHLARREIPPRSFMGAGQVLALTERSVSAVCISKDQDAKVKDCLDALEKRGLLAKVFELLGNLKDLGLFYPHDLKLWTEQFETSETLQELSLFLGSFIASVLKPILKEHDDPDIQVVVLGFEADCFAIINRSVILESEAEKEAYLAASLKFVTEKKKNEYYHKIEAFLALLCQVPGLDEGLLIQKIEEFIALVDGESQGLSLALMICSLLRPALIEADRELASVILGLEDLARDIMHYLLPDENLSDHDTYERFIDNAYAALSKDRRLDERYALANDIARMEVEALQRRVSAIDSAIDHRIGETRARLMEMRAYLREGVSLEQTAERVNTLIERTHQVGLREDTARVGLEKYSRHTQSLLKEVLK